MLKLILLTTFKWMSICPPPLSFKLALATKFVPCPTGIWDSTLPFTSKSRCQSTTKNPRVDRDRPRPTERMIFTAQLRRPKAAEVIAPWFIATWNRLLTNNLSSNYWSPADHESPKTLILSPEVPPFFLTKL